MIRENPIAYAKLTLRRALAWISVAPDYVPSLALTSTAQIDDKVVRTFRETWSTGRGPREPPDPAELQRSKRINSSILIAWSLLSIPLAVAGMILDASDWPKWLLLLPLITYVASLSVTFMDSRYREVMMPIWLIYAAVGFWGLPHLSRSWQRLLWHRNAFSSSGFPSRCSSAFSWFETGMRSRTCHLVATALGTNSPGGSMSDYTATIEWQRAGAKFTDNRYSRGHSWKFDGGVEVPGSSSPHSVRLPFSVAEAVDPEEAFVASLASCHMLWFLSIAAKHGYGVERYRDEAVGVMARNAEGKLAMTLVTLRPVVTFFGEKRPSATEHQALHHEAHEECYIASSVKTEVRCEPVALTT